MWIFPVIAEAAFFFLVRGVILSLLEIQIEGPCKEMESPEKLNKKRKRGGWAYNLPTIYRVNGPFAKYFGPFVGGRPATLYHLYLFLFIFLMAQTGFVITRSCSLYDELHLMAYEFAVLSLWDFDWFVLNPGFTYRGLGLAEWHNNLKNRLVWGIFPGDYAIGTVVSIGFAYLAAWAKNSTFSIHLWSWRVSWQFVFDWQVMKEHGVYLVCLIVFLFILILLAPLHHRWYKKIHDPAKDERHLAFPQG